MSQEFDISRLITPEGRLVGPEELQEIMAEQGYSAGERDQFLKALLTELGQADVARNGGAREAEILAEVRNILRNEEERMDEGPPYKRPR
ncbi:hypothetical protein ATO8_16650 [Roseivivax marinus]|jgi:hypothetical protein|uniref:Uncharacterized protein n=1 Tax=Roseivivax marinus TaxID=1379903 RepID=W4HGN8_9RHOB|nr:hypothetical protein [Roseivivax marinus]ETW11563.1 hypothetical protein ATO8_16650 [Roseivivax marinus]